jgi:hypothetical protein
MHVVRLVRFGIRLDVKDVGIIFDMIDTDGNGLLDFQEVGCC